MSGLLQKQPVPFSLPASLAGLKQLMRREPAKAVAAAVGVGLLIKLVPSRVVLGGITTVFATLIRPALLSLGLVKAAELCCKNQQISCKP